MSIADDQTQVATVDDPGARLAPGSGGPVAGRSIGRYLVLDELGRGGMGVVYAAYDPELDRKVAIKLLRRGIEGDGSRLRREAQAMARLSHPNVVTVFDVGQHDRRLFLAMDYVEGETLKAWLALDGVETRPWREILEVFVAAGRGLAAAHAADLVHRDFKPDNVLVSIRGEVKVVDFGIAKEGGGAEPTQERTGDGSGDTRPGFESDASEVSASPPVPESSTPAPATGGVARRGTGKLARGISALGTPLTMTGSIMGTPAYMAPEQHRGRATDGRTDQFSFAVALWEALCGRRPFEGATQASLRFHVCRGDIIDPPRDLPVPAHVFAALRRALSVEPDDRFPDMAALLEALSHDPRAARRRRWLGGGAAVLGVSLVAGLAVGLPWLGEARCDAAGALDEAWSRARAEALRERFGEARGAYAADVATDTVAALDDYAGRWREAYAQACRRVDHERFAVLTCLEDRRRELDAAATVLTEIPDAALDDTVEHAGEVVAALPDIDACTSQALGRALARRPTPPAELVPAVQGVERTLAETRALLRARRYGAALRLAKEATSQAESVAFEPLEARALSVLASAQADASNFDGAKRTYERAINRAHAAFDDETLVRAQLDFARLLVTEGGELERGARVLARAESTAARLGLGREHPGEGDEDDEADEDELGLVADLEIELLEAHGWHAQMSGDYERARALWEDALELQRAGGAEPVALAHALDRLASAHKRLGAQDEAERLAVEAHELLVSAQGARHPEVTSPLFTLGRIYRAQRRPEASVAAYLEVIEIRTEAYGPRHRATLSPYNNLGNSYSDAGDLEAAIAAWRKALDDRVERFGPRHQRVATVRGNLGNALRTLGRRAEAREELQASYDIYRAVFGDTHLHTDHAAIALAQLEADEGNWTAARDLALGALTRLPTEGDAVDIVADGHFVVARTLAATGATEDEISGALQEATLLYQKAEDEDGLAALRAWQSARRRAPDGAEP